MAHASPLNQNHRLAEASFLTYGPADDGADVVETFGELEAEYAAIRKACALFDEPHRAIIDATGHQRIEFLERMITQQLADLKPFSTRRAFWLNRKGRIDADLRLAHFPDRTLFDLDVLAAQHAVESLEAFVFAEDVAFSNRTDQMHRLSLHGPAAPAILADLAKPIDGPPPSDLAPEQCTLVTIAGHHVAVDRWDATAEPGLHLAMHAEHAAHVYEQLLERGEQHRIRPAGWHAYNIARIEAGTPIFNLDFGPQSIPNETGPLLHDRVSFTKGCYLGQEVVARIHALGKPKQTLAALRLHPDDPADQLAQPTTGAAVLPHDNHDHPPVGAITSSARSPMLSDALIAFAQLKTKHAEPGTTLYVDTPRGPTPATIQPQLAFYRPTR